MERKLTTLQIDTLRFIAETPSKVRQQNFGYGAWRITGANPSTVGKLRAAGLVQWGPNGWAELTDAGRAALAKVSTTPVGGEKQGLSSASQKPDPIEPRGSLPTNDGGTL